MQTTSLQFGQFTLKSPYRDKNGDAIFTQILNSDGGLLHTEVGLFMVWGGLGGSELSSRAGRVAIQTIATEFNHHIVMPFFESATLPDDAHMTRFMVDAFQQANRRILAEIPLGGGSLTASVIMDRRYHIFHVGDTQAFLVQESEIKPLTQVHDFVDAIVDAGHFASRKEVWDKANAVDNVVYNAFGQQETLNKVDVISNTFNDIGGLILFSRGLPLYLPEDRIEIQRIIGESRDAQDTCQRLISWTSKRGLYNDTSVIFVSHNFPFKS